MQESRRRRLKFVLVCLEAPFNFDIDSDMADQAQTAKKSKGFLNHLKKVFRSGLQSDPRSSNTPPTIVAPPALAPTVTTTATTANSEETAKLRAKYTHFRILVIGRANAGKTTLLKRVCNTKEDPVYSKVEISASLHTHLLLSLQINPTSKVPSLPISLIRSLTLVP